MEMPKHKCRSPRKWQDDKGRGNVGDFALVNWVSSLIHHLAFGFRHFINLCPGIVASANADFYLGNEDPWNNWRPWAGKHGRLLSKNHRALSRAHRRRALSGVHHY